MKIAVVENEEKDIQVYKEYISKYQESTKERIFRLSIFEENYKVCF